MVSLRFFAHSGYENHGMPIYKTIVGKRSSCRPYSRLTGDCLRPQSSRSDRRRGFARSCGTFQKRIDDGEPAEGAAVLHVFAVEGVAARLDCRGDDQRIVE
jgi:hypothetical protein